MSPIITYLLIIVMAVFALIIILELIFSRSFKKFLIQAVILLVAILILRMATGFPSIRVAFGGVSPVLAIVIMFVCTLFGIGAHYFFYFQGEFSWQTFLKPFFISPIILLPLIGSLTGTKSFEPVQLISFGFLSFQNGFFWKEVLQHAKPKTQPKGKG
jgi:hypothetical protein